MKNLKPKVLIVDDEVRILEGLSLYLGREYDVLEASSAREALDLLNRHSVAVVVSDLCMPGMDGIAFFEEVRQLYPETVRILLTGFASLETAITAINQGQVFRFLTKPCPVKEVVAMVRAGIEQHRLITADRALVNDRAQEITADLIRIDRMAQLGTMARGVAHEFNNLAVVSRALIAELGDARQRGETVPADSLGDLQWLGESIEAYANQLLQMGKAQSNEPLDILDLRRVIQRTVENLRLLGKLRFMALHVELPPMAVEVMGAQEPLMQVMVNLLNLAMEVAEKDSSRVQLTLSLTVQADTAVIEIEGFGHGTHPRISMDFDTPEALVSETGVHRDVSLMVSQEILGSHGGHFAWEVGEDLANRLVLHLPLRDADQALGLAETIASDETHISNFS